MSGGLDGFGWRAKASSTGISVCSGGGKERMDVLKFDSSSTGGSFVMEGEDRHGVGSLGEADENICGAGAREV